MTPRSVRFPWFIVNSLLVLPLGCVVALVWANALPENYYRFSHACAFAINDVGIAFFFGIMTKEIVEATLAGGVLHPWRRGLLPVAAAAGGVIVPIAIYVLFLQGVVAEPMLVSAWVVTSAADVAVCYLVGGLLFGRHPALPFLLLMSMAADAIGLAIIATFNPATPDHLAVGSVIVIGAIGLASLLRRRRTASFWPYLAGPGLLCWCGLFVAGVHPALALVPIVPFMPHARRDAGLFEDPTPKDTDTLARFERWWSPAVQAILFLFGLVNAGVPLHGLEAGLWAVPVATIIGRPLGVLVATEAAIFFGLHRVHRMGWKELIVVGFIASTGLTMALFFATATFPIGPLLMETKSGALFTCAGVAFAALAAWGLGVGRFDRSRAQEES